MGSVPTKLREQVVAVRYKQYKIIVRLNVNTRNSEQIEQIEQIKDKLKNEYGIEISDLTSEGTSFDGDIKKLKGKEIIANPKSKNNKDQDSPTPKSNQERPVSTDDINIQSKYEVNKKCYQVCRLDYEHPLTHEITQKDGYFHILVHELCCTGSKKYNHMYSYLKSTTHKIKLGTVPTPKIIKDELKLANEPILLGTNSDKIEIIENCQFEITITFRIGTTINDIYCKVDSNDKVLDLKSKIREGNNKIAADDTIILTYAGVEMQDIMKVVQYIDGKGVVVVQTLDGKTFVININDNVHAEILRRPVDVDPIVLQNSTTYQDGLMIQASCPKCKKPQLITKGYGIFKFKRELDNGKILEKVGTIWEKAWEECPTCHTNYTINKYFLKLCKLKINSVYTDKSILPTSKPDSINKEYQTPIDKVIEIESIKQFNYLVFEISKP